MQTGTAITTRPLPAIPPDAAVSLKRLRGFSGNATYRPAWATEEALETMRQWLDRLLRPAEWTETGQLLEQVSRMIAMPATEAVEGYIERLKDYPTDVLARACEGVVRSQLSTRPPAVGVFLKAVNADHKYQQRLRMKTNLLMLERLPSDFRPKPTGEERERIEAGFRRVLASL